MPTTKVHANQLTPDVALQTDFGDNWGELDELGSPEFDTPVVQAITFGFGSSGRINSSSVSIGALGGQPGTTINDSLFISWYSDPGAGYAEHWRLGPPTTGHDVFRLRNMWTNVDAWSVSSANVMTIATLAVSGNTTLGDASGDTLTVNAAAWTVPNTVTWTKTAESGVDEQLLRCLVSDSPSYFRLYNSTSNASEFAPAFEGRIEPGKATTALLFIGTKGVSTAPGNPAILFLCRYNSTDINTNTANTDIPDGGIAVEFRNRATAMIYVYGSGTMLAVKSGAGIGYGTGNGGTVTQATSKATGVTLNKASGEITMNNAALASDTTVSFTLTNSAIGAADVLILNHVSTGTFGAYSLNARCASGSATIDVTNRSGGSLSEAIVIRFALLKGATS